MRVHRRAGWWVVLALALGACARGPRTRVVTPPPATDVTCEAARGAVDVVHHDVALELALAPAALSGSGQVRVRARRPTSAIVLDVRGQRVTAARTEGGPLTFRVENGRLCATLSRALREGDEHTLQLAWQVPVVGPAPQFGADEVWAGYHASAWMPTLQDPAQRATLALRLTVPAGLRVAASGERQGETPAKDGRTTHAFALQRPSPPFLYAFAAGRWDEAVREEGPVRLRVLGPPGADLAAALDVTAPVLRLLQERTGAPYPAREYTQVFVRGSAAQEAAGLALVSASALQGLRRDPHEDWVFTHELAHQWFAWLVPCQDFADFWLNEGFATFFVGVAKEARWGPDVAAREVALWRERSARVRAQGKDAPLSLAPPGAPRPVLQDAQLQPRGITYARGALVLHALRAELGEEAFWAGVRRYVQARAGKGATSEDLRQALETASGRDLGDVFARQVYGVAREP